MLSKKILLKNKVKECKNGIKYYIDQYPIDVYIMWFILIVTILIIFLKIFYISTSYNETYDYIQHYI